MRPLGPGDPLRLGPYRLVGVLGAGGMGQVFLARDAVGALVAVKVLRPEFADDADMARRFVREAEVARTVTGEGVARVLGTNIEGGRLWIASEFLAGPTLDDAVPRHGPLAAPALALLGAALARTLADIHAAGLVHRDLKPSNIVLTSSGPRVIDFGIARPEHGLTLTATGQAPVTPGYGPPEQALGRRTGPKADVFSLGSVLAFAARGRPAFEGAHVAAVQYEVVHGEPELLGVPAQYRPLLAACLAKAPEQRPAPEEIVSGLAPPRRATPPWETDPWAHEIAAREEAARRTAAFPGDASGAAAGASRRRALLLMGGGGVLLAALGGGAYWLGTGGDQPQDAASATRGPVWRAKVRPEPTGEEQDPQPLWGPVRGTTGGSTDAASVQCARDVVVVAAAAGGLRAFAVTDGKPRWQDGAVGPSCLAVSDALILGTDRRGNVRGIRPADGDRLWSLAVDADHLLACDGTTVYLATREGKVSAVRLDGPETAWTVPMPVRSTGKAPARAVVSHGRLVLCGSDGAVTALRTRDGGRAWPKEVRQSGAALLPAVHGSTVILGGRSLTALALTDGAQKWSHPSDSLERQGSTGWSAPLVAGDAVYAADGLELRRRAVGEGGQTWTHRLPVDLPPTDAPVAQGHSIWIAADRTGQAGVTAVRARDGSGAWQYGAGPVGKPLLTGADNRVLVLRGDQLTALPVF